MGNGNQKEVLYEAINADKVNDAVRILKANPTWLNEPMTDDCLSTPLVRAAWRGHIDMIYNLLNLGADVNLTINGKLSPLQTAARRSKAEVVDYLIQKGADLEATSSEGIKFSITELKKLIKLGMVPKPLEKYEEIKFTKIPHDLDYGKMLENIKNGVPFNECPNLIKPKQEKTYKDPVIDPRESWGNFFKRVSNFQDPPLVERNELPAELQPQNRGFGKIAKLFTKEGNKTKSEPEHEAPEESHRLTPRKDEIKENDIELSITNKEESNPKKTLTINEKVYEVKDKENLNPSPGETVLKIDG